MIGNQRQGALRLSNLEELEALAAELLDTPSMAIELTGSFVAPAHLADTALVTVPFAVSGGLLAGFQLTGSGHVTLRLEWQSAIDGWAVRFSSFDFGGGRPG